MTSTEWEGLRLSSIDMHLHAGSERPAGATLDEYITTARAAGYRVVGVTDHFWYFLGLSDKKQTNYPGTLEGYQALAEDVHRARAAHPDMELFFGPEINMIRVMTHECESAFDAVGVTHFYAEPHIHFRTTGTYIDGFRRIAELRERYGVPGALVHPLRCQIGDYIKGGFDPDDAAQEPLLQMDDPIGHIAGLFDVDPRALGKAARETDVAIEINGGSWNNLVSRNREWFIERYLLFYRVLLDEDVRVTLGSDLHGVGPAMPGATVPAMLLGVQPADLLYLRDWAVDA